jgi:dethiobiotin synthetase
MIRIGVTGTDTDIGKTVVSVAILAMLRARGYRVAGMKPVETGVIRGDPASDAAALSAAAGGSDADEQVAPYIFPEPLAPWVAARREGVAIQLEELDRSFHVLQEGRDVVLVEGAGGLLVPLTREDRFDTLFRRWELGVIIVAPDRLGVLNHTLLTVQAARNVGLGIRAVVLNRGGVEPGRVAVESNAPVLAELLPDVPVTTFPRVPDTRNLAAMAAIAERSGLGALFPDREGP